jgi:hypothetical protein
MIGSHTVSIIDYRSVWMYTHFVLVVVRLNFGMEIYKKTLTVTYKTPSPPNFVGRGY